MGTDNAIDVEMSALTADVLRVNDRSAVVRDSNAMSVKLAAAARMGVDNAAAAENPAVAEEAVVEWYSYAVRMVCRISW